MTFHKLSESSVGSTESIGEDVGSKLEPSGGCLYNEWRITMSKLIIIRGNSGSGKSSLAKQLQEKLGKETTSLLLPQDLLRREMLYTNDGFNTHTIPLIINLLKYGKQNCDFVILEGILKADWYDVVFKEAVLLFANDIYAYYYDLSFEETLKRHSKRNKSLEFGAEEMLRWGNEKDYLQNINEKIITENDTLENALHTISNDLGLLVEI